MNVVSEAWMKRCTETALRNGHLIDQARLDLRDPTWQEWDLTTYGVFKIGCGVLAYEALERMSVELMGMADDARRKGVEP